MILAAFFAGLQPQDSPQLPDMSVRWTVQAPQVIIPAVTDYIRCLQDGVVRIAKEQSATNSTAMRRVVPLALGGCSDTRRSERTKAVSLLGGDAAAVDTVLSTIDAQLGQFPDAIAAAEARRDPPRTK